MNSKIIEIISQKSGLRIEAVANTVKLLSESATVPFIARYRKEMTGGLDEEQIIRVKELCNKFTELEKRKKSVLKRVEELGALTEELKKRISQCTEPIELEDIYLPYKPKKETKAAIAKKRGLEPLAEILFKQQEQNPELRASAFLNDEVKEVEEALSGARDIISEWISENEQARNIVRREFSRGALLSSKVIKGKEEEALKYRDYFEWSEPWKRCASHRFLAISRGEKEGFLRMSVKPDKAIPREHLLKFFVRPGNSSSTHVMMAVKESYKRLIEPSMENEFLKILKEKADKEAIDIFSKNLRQLLLAPPLGQKRILALDPGYRTGCKVVCLDEQGNLLHNDTIYPHKPREDKKMASKKMASMVNAYKIEAIAIGNGTAGRETESFIKNIKFDRKLKVFVVSEDGASVYSASPAARQEFPGYDVTVRGAVSIGRRLMDPLAELVKIEPKSIGVGQYQHDVNQKNLKESLDSMVEICVNTIGVNVNTASYHLLAYISGIGPTLAKNIVEYRKSTGNFKSREDLKNVKLMGPKAFEQSAGFLRIPGSSNPLDNSAVHPESYGVVKKIADDLQCNIEKLIHNEKLVSKIKPEKYISDTTGLPTLIDIKNELLKPGLDPRKPAKVFEFAENVFSIEDLKEGMIIPGIVNNITKFGAFVDLGIKQSGLIHISELADRFISDPSEVVKLHQHLKVRVKEIDMARQRIQLSLKGVEQ